MADAGGKKSKKKKGKTLNLNAFLSEGGKAPVIVPASHTSWADEMEGTGASEWDPYGGHKQPAFDVTKLPTAPKASLDNCIDPSRLPSGPPYTAYIGSLPYEVTEEEIANFFDGLKLVSIRLPGGLRQKGFGYAEFEDLESLKGALALNNEQIQNRQIKVDVAGHSSSQSGSGGYQREGGFQNDNYAHVDPERTNRDWRSKDSGDGQFGGRDSDSRGEGFGGYRRDDYGRDGGPGRDDRGGFGRESRGGFGREDRGGFGREDRGGFGREDRSGFGREDRSGFGREDRGGFGRENQGGGFGREDRSGGFGRSDRGGYGRDDRSGGFGRDDRSGGFGRDDRSGGYGREDSGSWRSNGVGQESFGSRQNGRPDIDNENWRSARAPPLQVDRDIESNGREDAASRDAPFNPAGHDAGPRERKKLNLKPRTAPSEVSEEATASSIFGGARPVDTSTKEKEIEERLAKLRVEQEVKPKPFTRERQNSHNSADGDEKGPNHGKDTHRKPRTTSKSDGSDGDVDKAKSGVKKVPTEQDAPAKQRRPKGTGPAVKYEEPKVPVFSSESMFSILATDDNSDDEDAVAAAPVNTE